MRDTLTWSASQRFTFLSVLFSSSSPPSLFRLPQHREGCFLSPVFGSDLITYLFCLSYSKLGLHVFAENRDFPLSSSSLQNSIQSLPRTLAPSLLWLMLCAIFCLTFHQPLPTCTIAALSVLSLSFWDCFVSRLFQLNRGRIALEFCNDLQRLESRPPPSQILQDQLVTVWLWGFANNHLIHTLNDKRCWFKHYSDRE